MGDFGNANEVIRIGDCFPLCVFAKNSEPCNFRLLQHNLPEGDILSPSAPTRPYDTLVARRVIFKRHKPGRNHARPDGFASEESDMITRRHLLAGSAATLVAPFAVRTAMAQTQAARVTILFDAFGRPSDLKRCPL